MRKLRLPTRWLFVFWLGLIAGSVLLALAAHAAATLPGDRSIAQELQEHTRASGLLLPLMVAVSMPGDSPWKESLVALAVVAPLIYRRWRVALFVALAGTSGGLLSSMVKQVVARPRPTPDLVHVYQQLSGYSFPSGHVVHYVVFFGASGYLAWQTLRLNPPDRPSKRFLLTGLLAVCAALILLVGVSRVFLGAHWPSDVLGGYLLGSAWLMLLVAVYRQWLAPGRVIISCQQANDG